VQPFGDFAGHVTEFSFNLVEVKRSFVTEIPKAAGLRDFFMAPQTAGSFRSAFGGGGAFAYIVAKTAFLC